MTKINENGQVEWTFEELDLEGTARELQKEYDVLREHLSTISSKYPKTRKAVIKRCSMLLDVRENIYKLMERGF